MKNLVSFGRVSGLGLLVAITGLTLAGCKSAPKVDWNIRIGTYTFDQAVTEMGPPDKTATLSDGNRVAEWVKRSRGGGLSFGIGTGFSSGNTGVGVGQSIGTSPSDKVLRLTFDKEDKLISWSKNY